MFVPDLEEIPVGEFDLRMTLNCGQVFHWQKFRDGYAGVIGSTPVYVVQRGRRLFATTGTAGVLRRYLALDHPLKTIYQSFPADPAMQTALQACRGLRIIRQPLWECLATFITSALKQVAHIAQISHCLRQRFGQPVGEVEGHTLFSYPAIERVAALQETELRACGLGFRAPSILATARRLAEGEGNGVKKLESLRTLSRSETLAALIGFRGVGTKVANCVLLFGYEHLDAFPIDVWIERVLRQQYFSEEPDAPLAKLQRFSEEYFGPYGGYAQQYLFHHTRVAAGKTPPAEVTAEREGTDAPIRRVRRNPRRTGSKK